MYDNNARGFNCSDRPAESTDNHANCPRCRTPILGLVTRGPSEHFIDPCGCRVTTTTARTLAGGADRGRGVATDGGTTKPTVADDDENADIRIRPNARYDALYGTNYAGKDPNSDEMQRLRDEVSDAADTLAQLDDATPSPEDDGVPDEDEMDGLSWEIVSPTSDDDLLRDIARWFDVVETANPATVDAPDDPLYRLDTHEDSDEIRDLLVRFADVQHYTNVLVVEKYDPDELDGHPLAADDDPEVRTDGGRDA